MFGFLSHRYPRLARLPLLGIGAVGILGCGATTAPIVEPPNSCELAAPIDGFRGALGLRSDTTVSLELLQVWWEGTEATAAALFHTDGQPAQDRRRFFSEHVYTDRPTLVVDGDAFALHPEFALSVAQLALSEGNPRGARQWLDRAGSDRSVAECIAALGQE